MRKIFAFFVVLVSIFSSCEMPTGKQQGITYIHEIVEVNDMAVNIAPTLGTASGQMLFGENAPATTPDSSATGSPASTIDGSDSTAYRSRTDSGTYIKEFRAPITVSFSAPIQVDSVDVLMSCGADNSDGAYLEILINNILVLSQSGKIGDRTGSLAINSSVSSISTECYFSTGNFNAWMSVKEIKVWVSYIDSGMRIRKGSVTIALARESTLSSPLRYRKGGVTYSLALVNPTDANASPLRIKTAAGIKAVAKI